MRLCLTAGTIMHATEKPITYWFKAMWWFTTRKSGVSAVNLQELLGLGSYHTAWTWLQKLRRCTIRKDREKLSFSKLPEGAFIVVGSEALLYWQGKMKRWRFEGYEPLDFQPSSSELVKVLTPFSIVKVLRYGFRPQAHESIIR
jgi:hypothetical protein